MIAKHARKLPSGHSNVRLAAVEIPQDSECLFGVRLPERFDDLAKVVQLNVSDKDYWIYTNSAFDNRRKQEVFERLGFERGLEFLASERAGEHAFAIRDDDGHAA